ncbi:MAG TPA: NAD-dependent epimerase/dehydratase family protein [Caulobacteraceae bacterium]|nr:NAD-dependent epimerase/dehydratase family protein [Caulobacteraceae bacterium]
MSERVLVTGGTGFVGGWAIVALLNRGYRVRTTVRSLTRQAGLRSAIARAADAGDRLEVVAADLTSDAGWAEAAAGCAFVMHIASPLAMNGETDPDALIAAAKDGTLRVLRAAVEARAERVVLTSSMAACTPTRPQARAFDESDWSDPDQPGLAAYRRSKILAERAAWDFMAGKATQLTTILPGAIFGPVLNKDQLGSVGLIKQLLDGKPPVLPRLAFNIIDVRDLAELHLEAMIRPAAAEERFIATGEALWYGEVAQALKENLGAAAGRVPTRAMPDFVARALSLVSPQMKSLMPLLGRTQKFSTQKARDRLGFAPRPAGETVVDCGRSLIA